MLRQVLIDTDPTVCTKPETEPVLHDPDEAYPTQDSYAVPFIIKRHSGRSTDLTTINTACAGDGVGISYKTY